MKTVIITVITIIAFIGIYLWSIFEEKNLFGKTLKNYMSKLYCSCVMKSRHSKEIQKSEVKNENFEASEVNHMNNDLENMKQEEIEERPNDINRIEIDFPKSSDENLDKQSNQRRQLEKLMRLAENTKAIPNHSQSFKKKMKVSNLSSQEKRIKSKLNSLEKTIKTKRKGRTLEPIPEMPMSIDSFSS